MKSFVVVVRATVTKTMHIIAESDDEAARIAQETFTVAEDDCDENYEQDILSVDQLKE